MEEPDVPVEMQAAQSRRRLEKRGGGSGVVVGAGRRDALPGLLEHVLAEGGIDVIDEDHGPRGGVRKASGNHGDQVRLRYAAPDEGLAARAQAELRVARLEKL